MERWSYPGNVPYFSCCQFNWALVRMNMVCYCMYNKREGDGMIIRIDFNSNEALYMQLRNQIVIGIATAQLREGDSLPSVRQLADTVGINMHTVNKAYALLREEGFIQLDRRHGAIVSLDVDKLEAMMEIKRNLRILLAKAWCKDISREEIHRLIDDIYLEYE